eukprot:7033030-Pyramimonas_sp.AAC.1
MCTVSGAKLVRSDKTMLVRQGSIVDARGAGAHTGGGGGTGPSAARRGEGGGARAPGGYTTLRAP